MVSFVSVGSLRAHVIVAYRPLIAEALKMLKGSLRFLKYTTGLCREQGSLSMQTTALEIGRTGLSRVQAFIYIFSVESLLRNIQIGYIYMEMSNEMYLVNSVNYCVFGERSFSCTAPAFLALYQPRPFGFLKLQSCLKEVK